MSIKLGGSKTKGTSSGTETFNRSGTSTTTATLPDWLLGPTRGLVDQIAGFSEIDPRSLVAGPSSLQNQAFAAAGGLLGGGGGGGLLAGEGAGLGSPGSGGPSFGPGWTEPSYSSTTGADIMGGGREATAGGSPMQGGSPPAQPAQGPAWQTLLNGGASLAAQAATAGPNLAQTYLSQGVTPGTAATATMPTMGPAAQAGFTPAAGGGGAGAGQSSAGVAQAAGIAPAQGYTAAQTAGLANGGVGAVNLGPATQAGSASLLDGLQNYMSPYTSQVVDAARADLDQQQAQQRAALLGSQGKRNAFGGSGVAIEGGLLAGEQARARNSIISGLLDQGFQRGTALSADDANRRQQTGLFNAGETNDMREAQGGFDMQGVGINANIGMANTAATNQASEFGANANNVRGIEQGRLGTQASIANADNQTQSSISNANNVTQASIASLNSATQTNIANMDAQTRVSLANAQSVNDQARLLAQLGVDVSTFNAGQINEMTQQALALSQQNNQFNAGQMTQGSQFNAGQQDTALNRALTGAGLLNDFGNSMGNNTRADIGLLGDLGATQRGIEQEGLLAGLNLTQAQIEMLAPFLSQLTGQTQVTNESGNSATTGRTSGTSISGEVGFTYGGKG